jgi:hypothetical protein
MQCFSHKGISAFLLLALFAPSVVILYPQQAHAQGTGAVAVVDDSSATSLLRNVESVAQTALQSSINAFSGISAAANEGNWFKEYVLDPIAYALAHAALQIFTNEMINWINSGFDGSPFFVENLAGSLQDVADRAVGVYLQAENLEFLCNPNLKNALIFSYLDASYNKKYRCEFTTLMTRYQNFLSGNFGDGGWDTWFDISVKSQNNDLGGYLNARIDLENSIVKEVNNELKILDFGEGFFSKLDSEFCEGKPRSTCNMTTPGRTVGTMLDWNVTSNIRQAELADEIDEAFAAIFSALIQRLMQDGLLALSDGGGWGDSSNSFSGLEGTLLDQVKREIKQEEEYLSDIGCPVNGNSTALSGNPTPGTGGACIVAWDTAVKADKDALSNSAYCATQRTVINELKTLLQRVQNADANALSGDIRDDVRVCGTNSHYGRVRDTGPGIDQALQQSRSNLVRDIEGILGNLERNLNDWNCPVSTGPIEPLPAGLTPGTGEACWAAFDGFSTARKNNTPMCPHIRNHYLQMKILWQRAQDTTTTAEVFEVRADYLDCKASQGGYR